MAPHDRNPEAHVKKTTAKESVDRFIKDTKEKKSQAEVSEQLAGTQEGVAEVMAGMEKPKEKISERKGESGEKGDIRGGGAVTSDDDDQAQAIAAGLKDYQFPSEIVMVKKVRTAIQAQIKVEWKKAMGLKGKLNSGGASGYNDSIAKIRGLKEVLFSLFTASMDKMKKMYMKYFMPGGKRKKLDEL